MRNIIVTEYLTVDGVFEEPGQWSFAYWSEEAMRYKRDELFSSDVQLLGRVTYEGFAKAWPTMPDTGDFGERMNSMPKYVVSTTLTHAEWRNTTIINKNVVQEIQKLKEPSGQQILVAGSGKLVHTLMQHHLVDEYRFMVHPVVLGRGKRLFPEGTEQCKFSLVDTKSFKTGIVVLHYQPERESQDK
jgi:dihydrofolate reductase